MANIIRLGGGAGGGGSKLKFTYTGSYNERDDGVVELLTSGAITFLSPTVIDAFLVGGGGSGGYGLKYDSSTLYSGGGGGGGYTMTVKSLTVLEQYNVTIGSGGNLSKGGDTTAFGYTAMGGGMAKAPNYPYQPINGGDGGSGGGVGAISYPGSDGGTNGNDGAYSSYVSSKAVGKGQGTTTREFGESTGKLYAGGGGGGGKTGGSGGAGGGGNGGSVGVAGTPGTANTGGGGGGGGTATAAGGTSQGMGGSGIVCIRLSIY